MQPDTPKKFLGEYGTRIKIDFRGEMVSDEGDRWVDNVQVGLVWDEC